MFKTAYTREELKRYNCNPGSGTKTEYMLRVSGDIVCLEPTGKCDFYGYIQSHADSVDIHKILERCALANDYSLLNRMPASFMDVTQMPKNLADAYSQIQDAKNMFDRMPTEIKQSYDNNFLQFISDIGSKKFEKVTMDFLNNLKAENKVVEDIKTEVKNES